MGLSATVAVSMAFGDNWKTAATSWTDISPCVKAVDVSWGRSRPLDRPETAKIKLLLSNTDRRFEPGFDDGGYYPDIKTGVPVKVEAVYSGTTYGIGYGYVESWPQTYGGGNKADVVCSALGGISKLALAELVRYPELVAGYAPFSYWRMQETSGTDATDEGSDENDGTYTGSPTLGADGEPDSARLEAVRSVLKAAADE